MLSNEELERLDQLEKVRPDHVDDADALVHDRFACPRCTWEEAIVLAGPELTAMARKTAELEDQQAKLFEAVSEIRDSLDDTEVEERCAAVLAGNVDFYRSYVDVLRQQLSAAIHARMEAELLAMKPALDILDRADVDSARSKVLEAIRDVGKFWILDADDPKMLALMQAVDRMYAEEAALAKAVKARNP